MTCLFDQSVHGSLELVLVLERYGLDSGRAGLIDETKGCSEHPVGPSRGGYRVTVWRYGGAIFELDGGALFRQDLRGLFAPEGVHLVQDTLAEGDVGVQGRDPVIDDVGRVIEIVLGDKVALQLRFKLCAGVTDDSGVKVLLVGQGRALLGLRGDTPGVPQLGIVDRLAACGRIEGQRMIQEVAGLCRVGVVGDTHTTVGPRNLVAVMGGRGHRLVGLGLVGRCSAANGGGGIGGVSGVHPIQFPVRGDCRCVVPCPLDAYLVGATKRECTRPRSGVAQLGHGLIVDPSFDGRGDE